MRTVYASRVGGSLYLGKRGTNETARVLFPLEEGMDEIAVLHQRVGDEHPYAVPVSITAGGVEWVIGLADTAVAGTGVAEVIYKRGGAVAKSVTYTTRCDESIDDGEIIVPTAAESWVQRVVDLTAEAQSAAGSAETSAGNAADSAEAAQGYTVGIEEAVSRAESARDAAEERARGFYGELQNDFADVKESASVVTGFYPWSYTYTDPITVERTTRYKMYAAASAVCYVLPVESGQVYRIRKPRYPAVDGIDANRFSLGTTAEFPKAESECLSGKVQTSNSESYIQIPGDAKYLTAYVYYPVKGSDGSVILNKDEVLDSVRIWKETIGKRSSTEFYSYYSDVESYAAFRDKMNETAQRLGMTGSYFYSASGLTRRSYTTPQDMAKLAVACAGSEKVMDWCSTYELTANIYGVNPREVTKTNIMLPGTNMSDAGFPGLGGKGGSFTWLVSPDKADWGLPYDARRDTVNTRFKNFIYYFDCCGRAAAAVACVIDTDPDGNGKYEMYETYASKSAAEAANLLEYRMGGRDTPPEMPCSEAIVASGGGYVALVLPDIPAGYGNNYSVGQMMARGDVVSDGADEKTMPASVSKLLTALIAAEYAEFFHRRLIVHYSDVSAGSGGNYAEGDEFRFDDAMRICLMESSNTLAHMIGREIGLAILHAKNQPPEYDAGDDDPEDFGEDGEQT